MDRDHKESFVRDAAITAELIKFCDELIKDITILEPGLKYAIDKYSRMRKSTYKATKVYMVAGYVKYVLIEGSKFEKTRLIRNLDIKLALHDRRIVKI